ncbi:MAG: hypothetical protein Q8P27_01195 [Candidatus Peregrinibacteria bacterium]|nr:hypothetical protein [Candidatus Peregrinibacteria bacterium]
MLKINEKNSHSRKQGTTLIEIMLYFSLVGVFLLAAMTFSIQILNVYGLSANIHELQSNLDLIGQKMVYTIQVADSVDDSGSVFDSDTGTLSLNMPTVGDSPTSFYLSDGDVFMKEGMSSAIQLNTDAVTFNTLRFHKVSYAKSPDQIVIDAQMSSTGVDISNLQQDFELHLSISLRAL